MGNRSVSLADAVAIQSGVATTATGTTAVNGATIDTAGYEGVMFVVKLGTAAANNTIKLQSGAESDLSDAADLAGTSVGVGASDEIVWAQIIRPLERYVRVVVSRGTSTTVDWGVALLFGGRSFPQDNTTAGTIHGEAHESPAEGTA